MAKRFLLVTEEWAGSGHKMAAIALEEALLERKEVEWVKVVGGLETASPALRELSCFFYRNMLRYGQSIWQHMYEQERLWGTTLKKPVGKWLSKRLEQGLLKAGNPDVVIATHAYCLTALAEAKRKRKHPFHLVSIPTDYHVNRFWVHPLIDTYIVGHESVANRLVQQYGVKESQIHVFGIPIRKAFAQTAARRNRIEERKQLGLNPDQFTVLISGGEGGYGQMDVVVDELLGCEEPLQIIVVTGNNHALRQQLEHQLSRTSSPHTIQVKGYEERMWKWIAAADVYVTKPGGISCAEALALSTPLIVYQPLPGQERHNTTFLLQHGAGTLADHPRQISDLIQHSRDKQKWTSTVQRMEAIRRPFSTQQTVEYLLGL